ncbi:MAG: DNA cytosine methyltransferase [Verrucomicrobiota bacterium]
MRLSAADLFCGAGGTSGGMLEALQLLGYRVDLTAINHWDVAIATHSANHPGARHLCTSLDNVNPRELFKEGGLDILWASPECTHHSQARGGKPISDQSRATAWCVTRWAEALRPNVILVENVPEFQSWGPIGTNGRPLKSRKGEVFEAWCSTLRALGYRVEHRVLCCADYGDPTTRRRLFVQAVRGRRRIVWPNPTHVPQGETDLLGQRRAWVPARDIINWNTPSQSIFDRKRPLKPKTLKRVWTGLLKYGLKPYLVTPGHGDHADRADQDRSASIDNPLGTVPTSNRFAAVEPYLVEMRGTSTAKDIDKPVGALTTGNHQNLAEPYLIGMEHGGSEHTSDKPLPTVTCAKGGAFAAVEPYIIPQQSGGASADSIERPVRAITSRGAEQLATPFLVKYNGTADSRPIVVPLDSVTTKDRFALVEPILAECVESKQLPVISIEGKIYQLDIRLRMLQPRELARAQGFPDHYEFTGNKTEITRQIGNAVPWKTARALVLAVASQNNEIAGLLPDESQAEGAA